MQVGVHQKPVLSPLVFAIVVDAIPESEKKDLMNEILYAGGLDLKGESMKS